jgi:hypothetical protein
VYELYCSMRNYTVDTARAAAPSGGGAAVSNGQGNCSTAVGPVRCFSELIPSEPPTLENLTAKSNCLQYLSGRGLDINGFSERQVFCLLQRRFSRFVSAGSESAAVPLEVIVSYCEKVFTKFPLEDKALPLADAVLIDSHIKACAKASAAAAEKLKKDLAQKTKLAAAKAARGDAGAEASSQPGTAATALRTAPSLGRTSESRAPAPLKPNQKTKRKISTVHAVVDFEVTVRSYLRAKTAGFESTAQRPRLAK